MAEDFRERLIENIYKLKQKHNEAVKALENFEAKDELYHVWNKLDAYQPGDSPDKAVYLLAVCHTLIAPFARAYSAIHNYQEAQRRLDEYDRTEGIANG